MQIYSHLERQIIVRQQDGFPSVQSLSHLGQGDASRSCDELRWGRGLLSVQIYSHLERQIIVRQQDGFPSVQSLSHQGQGDASRTSCDGVADS